jgi:CRISPR-associated protein Cmr6
MSRRSVLEKRTAAASTHAGLWWDRYIGNIESDADRQRLSQEITTTIREPDLYRSFFERWKETLRLMDAMTRVATVRTRMIIGLGAESVLETAITLHRTYGVPYIPGSALKGLTAAYARNQLDATQWGKESEGYAIVFGTPKQAGYLTFYDALYIPGSGFQQHALWPDVLTVHHPLYYSGTAPPTDKDDPNPIPFLTATGSYLLALGIPPGLEAWGNTTWSIMQRALNELGIGAKTSSGYGRMNIVDQ